MLTAHVGQVVCLGEKRNVCLGKGEREEGRKREKVRKRQKEGKKKK